ncbi:hypothetical protein PoB_007437100 [Plakobranchus ocellatus]|uniref:Uncharacterized protein n=1 Tax=Plakobranchus ocellatus TaxID=259542 RepID=A0AAV4DVK1_9GAST|nr:hypothetical protein PoB_007437100 [Plakobranchus ocellatus]
MSFLGSYYSWLTYAYSLGYFTYFVLEDEEDVHAPRPSNRIDKTRQGERKLQYARVGLEPVPPPASTDPPDRGTKRTRTEPSAFTNKIESFDSGHSPSHSIRLEYLCYSGNPLDYYYITECAIF